MSLRSEARLYFKKNFFGHFNDLSTAFRVLVLDEHATTILSSCFKMHEITSMGITLVENITKKRQPLPLEAIYLFESNNVNFECLMSDFTEKRQKYNCAHVFVLNSCPEIFLKDIALSPLANFLITFIELEYAYLPIESHIYSLDAPEIGMSHPALALMDDSSININYIKVIAQRLVTLCQTLNECPRICFLNGSNVNMLLAKNVKEMLNKNKSINPNLGLGPYKDKSILLIVDRSVDLITPLLHELTLQAMVHDIVENIEENVYTIDRGITLDLLDRNHIWSEYRHKHIATIDAPLNMRIEEFSMKNSHLINSKSKPKDAKEIKKIINWAWNKELQQEEDTLLGIRKLVNFCLESFSSHINVQCLIEQDLVMGQDHQGNPLRNEQGRIANCLGNSSYSNEDKMRLVLLYLLTREGSIDEAHLDKLMQCGSIVSSYKRHIIGMCKWFGGQLVQPIFDVLGPISDHAKILKLLPTSGEILSKLPFRKWCLPIKGLRNNRTEDSFTVSRWTPYLMDIMENCISNKLDQKVFTFLPNSEISNMNMENGLSVEQNGVVGVSLRYKTTTNVESSHIPNVSARKYGTGTDNAAFPSINDHIGPRLIICVLGGFTFSETRTAYETTKLCAETRLAATDPSLPSSEAKQGLKGFVSRSEPNHNSATTRTIVNGGGMGWNWEVILGGTHLLTPQQFLNDLSELSEASDQSQKLTNGFINFAMH